MNQTRWQQIETLYHAALERPLGERIRFLSDSCVDDAELYQEVHSLLSSNEQVDGFLAEPEFDLGLKILSMPPPVLEKGQNFGNFKVLNFLERGGMGEVYLAQDARLGRLIALKVLPADVASDPERIRRFMQEARAASALNHPNILTIHEIGETDGWRFIASEFVEGETLRERLKRDKPPAPQETLEIALQIADGLNAAHKAGIIHRDIKPENIMLREDGLVKVLDFGLAKLTEKLAGQNSASDFVSTNPGMIMGTVAYMSPEQIRGQKTDARSDIWSFGVVLYEMLSGKLPFKGDTTSDIIAAILTTEAISSDKHLTEKPENLQRILGKALSKDPAHRYQSAKEIADELKKTRLDINSFSENDFFNTTDFKQIGQTDSRLILTSDTLLQHQTDGIKKKSSRNKIVFAFASVLLLILAGGYATFNQLNISSLFSREPMKITRIFDTGKTINAAISPDGKYVVHALADTGKQSLWIKHIATNSNVQLVLPQNASFTAISFSNDGNYIYYVKGTQSSELYQVPVLGGDSKKILENVDSPISFSPDGRQFAFLRWLSKEEAALIIVNTDGNGERQLATRSNPEAFGGSGVSWSPDGKFIAGSVFVKGESTFMSIALIPVDGGDAKLISPQKWRLVEQVVWLPDGSGLLGAATGETGESLTQIWFFPVSGEDARLITNDLNQYSGISLTADAKQFLTIHWQNRENIWLLPNGKTEEARMLSNNIHARYRFIALAPDGRIVFPSNENASDKRDIWIINPDGSNAKQLTANAGGNILPCVTGDGRYIVFASNRTDLKTYHIWRMNMDGTDPVQLTDGDGERGPNCSPDGKTVFYLSGGPNVGPEKSRLWKTSIDGGETVQLTDYPTGFADVSPDGKYIALRFKLDNASPFKLGIIPITGGKPVKVFDFDFKQNSQIRWKPDGRSITIYKTENGVSNIWEQPVGDAQPKPLTKFTAELILGFDWSKDNDLICARGYEARDPVLISNFR